MSSVSIIIPSFRQPQFLGRAIESCLTQDHTDLEVIVVDDRSRDASLGLALSWSHRDDRVRVLEASENGGLGKARNMGIAHATGEYLCFLDSDDYLLAGSLSSRLEALPDAVAKYGDEFASVYGDWQHVAEAIDHPTVRAPRSKMPVVSAANYTGENVFICSAPLVRRDFVVAAGGFPEGLAMLEDFGLWARLIARGAVFVPVRHVVATYRQRPNSMLRGDGVVSMADHAEVINSWMANEGVDLADGGAMDAWLGGEMPFSHGRMSWNVPSVLGSFGGGANASAVRTPAELPSSAPMPRTLDFMATPTHTGLNEPDPLWSPTADEPSAALLVHTVEQSLEAVAISQRLRDEGVVAAVFVDDLDCWDMFWPLPLAGHSVRSSVELDGDAGELDVIDLAGAHRFADLPTLAAEGAETIWPATSDRQGSVVYVPDVMLDYPALDAWISVALHALAEADLDPMLMADPHVREQLHTYRSSIFSVQALMASSLVVCPSGPHLNVVEQLAPTVEFDPSATAGHPLRTGIELREAIRQQCTPITS